VAVQLDDAKGEVKGEVKGEARSAGIRLWRLVPLALVLLGIGAVFATGAHRYLRLEALLDHRERLQGFVAGHGSQAVLLYMGVYIAAVTLSVPGGAALTIIGGFLFGWLVGGAAAAISATLGAIGVFLIARTSIGDALLRRAGKRVQALAAGFRRDAFSYLLFLRFLPVVPFWVTNLASALFGVPLKTFVLATQIGLIPGTFAFAAAGSGLDAIIAAQQAARAACLSAGGTECGLDLSLRQLLTPQILAAFVVLGVLALAPVAVKRYSRRKGKGLDGDGTEA
jgi:uncharacterized membrane protein YdjX (TVP38/TMEM64 family)